ncbi:MAG: hypothetical protein MJZ20_13090 [Bacteroidaceae bacterium]|nr:hypothetical protein [Bacteroidaceae bacterium]
MKKLFSLAIALLLLGSMNSCHKDDAGKKTKKIETVTFVYGSYLQWYWENDCVDRIEYNNSYSSSPLEQCDYTYDSQGHFLTADFTSDGFRFEYKYSNGNISQIDLYEDDEYIGKYLFNYSSNKLSNVKIIAVDTKKALPFPKPFDKVLKNQKDDFVAYDIRYKWEGDNVKKIEMKGFYNPDELEFLATINFDYDQGNNPFYNNWGFPLTDDGLIRGLYIPFDGMPFSKNNCTKMTVESTDFDYEETTSEICDMEYSYDEDHYPTMLAVFIDNELEDVLRFNYLGK